MSSLWKRNCFFHYIFRKWLNALSVINFIILVPYKYWLIPLSPLSQVSSFPPLSLSANPISLMVVHPVNCTCHVHVYIYINITSFFLARNNNIVTCSSAILQFVPWTDPWICSRSLFSSLYPPFRKICLLSMVPFSKPRKNRSKTIPSKQPCLLPNSRQVIGLPEMSGFDTEAIPSVLWLREDFADKMGIRG